MAREYAVKTCEKTGQFDRNFYDIRDYSNTISFAVSQTAELLNYEILGGNLGPKWLLLTSLCVIATLVLAVATKRTRFGGFGMLTALAVGLVFLLLAGIGKHPYGGIRHCLVVTPLIFATMANGLGGLVVSTNRLARIVPECLFTLIVGLMVYGVVRVIPGENRYQFSHILPALSDRATPSDVLYVTGRYDSVAVGHLVSGDNVSAFRLLQDAMKANGNAVDLPTYPLRVYACDLTDTPKQPNSERALPIRFTPMGRIWVTDTFRSEPPPRPVHEGFAFQIVDEIKAPGARATCWQFVAKKE